MPKTSDETNHQEVGGTTEQTMGSDLGGAVPGVGSLTDLVATSTQFSHEAITRHAQAMTALSSARSPQDLVKIQGEYSKSALEAYMQHSQRMTQLASEFVAASTKAMTDQAATLIKTTSGIKRD